MERYKTIHENKVMINPPTPQPLKEWKKVPLPKRAVTKPTKPKTPLDWNWTAIITWSVILAIATKIWRYLYNLIT
jgi:hypothetical protein